jgi:hypothetical protein
VTKIARKILNQLRKRDQQMRTNVILTLCIAATAALFSACGAPAANTTNANAKPANTANTMANTSSTAANTASNTAANTASNTAAAPATSGAAQDFMLVNKTGVIIDKLFISPSDTDDWEEDILGQDVLADGASLDIKFKRSEKAAKWDLKIEDSKGASIEWNDLNLLEIEKITLRYDGKKATAETE